MAGVRATCGGDRGNGFMQPGEEVASGEPDSSLPAPVRVSSRRQSQALLSAKLSVWRTINSKHKLKQEHLAFGMERKTCEEVILGLGKMV